MADFFDDSDDESVTDVAPPSPPARPSNDFPVSKQSRVRQKQFLSNGVSIMAAQHNVFLQRITSNDLVRYYKTIYAKREEREAKREEREAGEEEDELDDVQEREAGEKEDELDDLLQNMDNLNVILTRCTEADVNVSDSIEELVRMKDKNSDVYNPKSGGLVILAWKILPKKDPELVGAATCCNFHKSYALSTEPQAEVKKLTKEQKEARFTSRNQSFLDERGRQNSITCLMDGQYKELQQYMGSDYLYLDTLCAATERSGVGTLLTLAVYEQAVKMKKKGVIAMSYSEEADVLGPSYKMFRERLKFEPLINNNDENDAQYAYHNESLFGKWFIKKCDNIDVSAMNETALKICSRRGIKDKRILMWRCPR